MKESNSFEDVVKKVLTTEKKRPTKAIKPKRKQCKINYVEEAIGGAAAGANSTSAGTDGMGGFSKASSDGSTASIDMRDIGKEEDSKAKSHTNKPYPLETVLDFIAQSGEELQNAQDLIHTSLKKNVSLSDEQKTRLKAAQQTISSSLGNIAKAAKVINSITI